MIAVISPAKTLDYETALPSFKPTVPRFKAEAATLAHEAAKLSPDRLSSLMKISPALASLNAERFRSFDDAAERAAMFAFAGDVYTGLDAYSLDEPAIAFAQKHLRMLSGLYGLLRPLDQIRPYRLEMGTRWAPDRPKLTDWWDNRVADLLAKDLEKEGTGTVLNLASQEYWAAVEGKLADKVRIIAVDFREGQDARFVAFHAKRARGMMARWLVEHRIERADDMRGFDTDGYRFDGDASGENNWRFVRA